MSQTPEPDYVLEDLDRETDYDRLEDVDDRFTQWYDDVFDAEGNLVSGAGSVLRDEFLEPEA